MQGDGMPTSDSCAQLRVELRSVFERWANEHGVIVHGVEISYIDVSTHNRAGYQVRELDLSATLKPR